MIYVKSVLYFLISFYIYDSLMAYIAYLMAGIRMPYRKAFTLQIPAALIQSMAYSTFIFNDDIAPSLLNYYFWELVYRFAEIVIVVFWIYILFKNTDKKKRFFYGSTVFPFFVSAGFCTNALVAAVLPEILEVPFSDFVWTFNKVFLFLASYLIANGCVALIVRLISKTSIWSKLQAFGNYPKLYIPMGMIYFLFYAFISVFVYEYIPGQWYIPAITLPYLTLLAVVVLMVSDIKKTENLNTVQSLLLQQQNYINKLEVIQKEIRGMQHDYKNMLAGLYAQASEGNADAVKEYIDAKLLKVDEGVRENLRQMNQLSLIELPELKGLIMTKLLEAERDEVSFHMEVMYPVSRVSMATEDLLRCVGILLDNAIEAAKTYMEEGSRGLAVVTLLLLQEDGALTIVVKNPVMQMLDLSLIWSEGYSTKGSGRGVGLSNYRNIIRKYPNTAQETKIEGEYFIQTLVLAMH